jgi:hypothetical protein
MGEAERRKGLGLAPRALRPGEQIQVQVDLDKATPKVCECGHEFFEGAIKLFTVSAILSPVGKELTAQVPCLLCKKCGKPLDLKEVER